MIRTVINVTGDAVASVVVAKSEGQLDQEIYHASADTLDAREA
jgi:Na+/H+-dicarboxylate symporter